MLRTRFQLVIFATLIAAGFAMRSPLQTHVLKWPRGKSKSSENLYVPHFHATIEDVIHEVSSYRDIDGETSLFNFSAELPF